MRLRLWYRKTEALAARLHALKKTNTLRQVKVEVKQQTKDQTTFRSAGGTQLKVMAEGALISDTALEGHANSEERKHQEPKKRQRNTKRKPLGNADAFVSEVWKDEIERHVTNTPKYNDAEAARIRERPVTEDKLAFSDFCDIIKLNRARARYVLDFVFQVRLPGFRTLTMSNEAAQGFIKRYGGLYFLYRVEEPSKTNDSLPRAFGTHDVITRITVAVRYPVPHRSMQKENQLKRHEKIERVRAKFVLPRYPRTKGQKLEIVKYDGFVSPTLKHEGEWQWLMETRLREGPETDDMMLAYSRQPSHDQLSEADIFTQRQGDPSGCFAPSDAARAS